MLLAPSESAVTKKPRLRLMMRRSSSDRPLGSFHRAMSRDMFTSCGIQWLAQVARYFSQAHLYLKGTSWLTSVWPLMMRLSAALTRRVEALAANCAVGAAPEDADGIGAAALIDGDAIVFRATPDDGGTEPTGVEEALEESSAQTSMVNILWHQIMEGCCEKHQALLDKCGQQLLLPCIETRQKVHEYGDSGRQACWRVALRLY